ncbi:oxidoreductase domain protein [Desulfonatronospira thiodismutans ASO3-1]|uniref:Oxidoreductase domain protein n=1 Tax=Desulfonatronospira thiodismutans ASO3-1 TaxID=555779 RepID=D6SKU4_9BACT|nr:Gfo/Idh/MocA family oxidoreductase [Desulfonatronospira thiodismutans]EFI35305.1 oxidoreductase domain protein [Desulfonatronospira thiodismutans ASO3-1]
MINTAVIGLGKMGISHCAIINAHPKFNLVAVSDTSSLLLRAIEKFSSFKPYSDYRKMIEQNVLDAVFVATPTNMHADMVMFALENKVHIFCEKPLGLNVTQSKDMADKVKKYKLIGQVGYHNRFLSTFNYMKKLLNKSLIGDIYHFTGEAYGPVVVKAENKKTWRSRKSEGGGCLFDYASHVINLIEYVFDNIQTVDSVMLKKVFSTSIEDAVYASLTLTNAISGTLSVNWSEETYRKMSTSLKAWGTKGKIIADAQEIKIYLKTQSSEFGLEKGWNTRYITDFTADSGFYLRGEEYSAQVDYFDYSIKNNLQDNINSFDQAYKTDLVIDLMVNNFKRERGDGQNITG